MRSAFSPNLRLSLQYHASLPPSGDPWLAHVRRWVVLSTQHPAPTGQRPTRVPLHSTSKRSAVSLLPLFVLSTCSLSSFWRSMRKAPEKKDCGATSPRGTLSWCQLWPHNNSSLRFNDSRGMQARRKKCIRILSSPLICQAPA